MPPLTLNSTSTNEHILYQLNNEKSKADVAVGAGGAVKQCMVQWSINISGAVGAVHGAVHGAVQQ